MVYVYEQRARPRFLAGAALEEKREQPLTQTTVNEIDTNNVTRTKCETKAFATTILAKTHLVQ